MRSMRFLVPLLVLSALAACMETDIAVPGFPEMVEYFRTSEEMIQMTLTINFFAFALAGMVYGPLADAWGRRPVMMLGNVIFLVGALGTALAPSLGMLIAWRFIQGLGASAVVIVALTMIVDAYEGDEAAKNIGIMNSMITLGMAAAPIIGGFLATSYGWRSNYTSIAGICLISTVLLWLFLPETHEERVPLNLKRIMGNYGRLLKSVEFNLFASGPSILCAGYMGFVGTAVFYYVEQLGMSPRTFSLYQVAVIGGFSGISFFSGRVIGLLGSRRTAIYGLALSLLGGFALMATSIYAPQNAMLLTISMSVYSVGVACYYCVIYAASMEIFPDIKGAASALLMTVRLLLIMFAIWLGGYLYTGHSFVPVASVVFGSALITLLVTAAIYAVPNWRARLA